MAKHTINNAQRVADQKDELSNTRRLPGWVLAWFYATGFICTWDATFIMLRPRTLPGGSLSWLFYLYKYYVTVDQRYMDTEDAFVFAQSLLNYVEVVGNFATIIMHYRSSKHTAMAGFTVSVMTWWKTVLYFLMMSELCTGGQYRQGNTVLQEIFLVAIPNGVWIVLPMVAMYALWGRLLASSEPRTPQVAYTNGAGPYTELAGKQNGELLGNGHIAATVKQRKVANGAAHHN